MKKQTNHNAEVGKMDLVSRQAAIEALKKHEIELPIYSPRETDVFWDDAIDCCVSEIEDLPSAQPEIIRCKDCEWWEKQKDSAQGRCDLMQMYPTGGWYCGNAQRRVTDGGLD